LLPVIDLAPWTGWLIVEEFDILVLGAAAGGYASLALRRGTRGGMSAIPLALIGLVGAWTAMGIYRGFNAAGSAELGWFDGYYAASNSLRVAKSYLLATLMLPLLAVEMRRSCPRATGTLAAGLVAGLGLASLAVLWERLAFPGLLNFSSDYRVTALFWEMHVGGAALDGFLALTVPFAIRELLAANTGMRRTSAALCLLLAAYACLATFSRGVYLAVPVSVGLLALLLFMKGDARALPNATLALLKGCVLMAVMSVLFHLVFRAGGYRSLLAVLGAFALTLPLGNVARGIPARAWAAGLAAGAIAAAAGGAISVLLFKGIYVNFALAFATCALLLLVARRSAGMLPRIGALGAYAWLTMAAAGVALGWGGTAALRDSAIVLSLMMAVTLWNARADTPLWPEDLPFQGAIVGLAVLVAFAAAVFSGGAYFSSA